MTAEPGPPARDDAHRSDVSSATGPAAPDMAAEASLGSVRPAAPADVEAVAASELESFPDDAWTADYLSAVVEGQLPTIRLLVLEAGESGIPGISAADIDPEIPGIAGMSRVVGHAIVSVLFEDAELQRIAIVPAYRRRGLGRLLLRAAEGLSRAEGAERLLLEVREGNEPALALYRAEGYAEIDRRLGYYRDGTTGIVLESRLS